MSDPVLDAIFAEDEFESSEREFKADNRYGEGKHVKNVVMKVTPRETEYGRSLTIECNLTGDADNPKPFTFFADAPVLNGDAERHAAKLNQLKTYVHATGTWCEFNEKGRVAKTSWPKNLADFSNDEQWARLQSVFTALEGKRMPINVKYNASKKDPAKLYKNVWGMDARRDD